MSGFARLLLCHRRKSSLAATRNLGIIAHIDAGKTTVTERLLMHAGLTRRCGSVDSGDTVMDYLPEERERGITIASAAITLPWQGHSINLIDTPGHVDFTVEVERSLRVLEGAVLVLDASKGVQSQTHTVWRQAERHGVQPIVFVNKMDKVGASVELVMQDIRMQLGREPIALNLPVMAQDEWTGKLEEQLHTSKLHEHLAQHDDIFLETYLDAPAAIDQSHVLAALRRSHSAVIPVLFGSASKDIGIPQLLDAIVKILPPPNLTGSALTLKALAFKVVFDTKRQQLLVYVRVYEGCLTRGSRLYNVNRRAEERASKVMQVMADELIEIGKVEAGGVAILMGLKYTATGDTLTMEKATADAALAGIPLPSPVIGVSIEAASGKDQDAVDEALRVLLLEDPSVQMIRETDASFSSNQTVLRGMGELHLEILQKRLSELGANFSSGPIHITMKESLEPTAVPLILEHAIDREVLSVRIVASIKIHVEPRLAKETRFVIVAEPVRASWTETEIAEALHDGFTAAMGRGPLQGNPFDPNTVSIRVLELGVQSATTLHAIRCVATESLTLALQQLSAHVTAIEPLALASIDTPVDFIGDLTADLFGLRECQSFEQSESGRNGMATLSCLVPFRTMLGYSTWLRSKTAGQASFSMEFARYGTKQKSH